MITLPLYTTAQRLSMEILVTGMVIFDTDLKLACLWDGSQWVGLNIAIL